MLTQGWPKDKYENVRFSQFLNDMAKIVLVQKSLFKTFLTIWVCGFGPWFDSDCCLLFQVSAKSAVKIFLLYRFNFKAT